VALRPAAWHLPERVGMVNWLDTFAEMAAVREAIDEDPILGTRVDTPVGTEFSLRQRRLDWLLVKHLLEPMIIATGSYQFDTTVLDLHYSRLEAGLLADVVRLTVLSSCHSTASPRTWDKSLCLTAWCCDR